MDRNGYRRNKAKQLLQFLLQLYTYRLDIKPEKDIMRKDFRGFLCPSQQSRRPSILRMVEKLSELANGPLCTLGGWRMLVKLLCSVSQPEKLQCAESLLDDIISSDLHVHVQCVHTVMVGLQTAFVLQLCTVERLNNIQWCII
jgi:hypothetical protein